MRAITSISITSISGSWFSVGIQGLPGGASSLDIVHTCTRNSDDIFCCHFLTSAYPAVPGYY
eukprot:3678558-Rhodomonas_salina.2